MSKGLYFYKLVSPYEEDVTKNCKLTVNEIDSNFLNLKDYDIEKAELDRDNLSVILTRKDGEKLVVDLTPILSGSVYDLEVVYDNPSGECTGSSVHVNYNMLTEDGDLVPITVPIEGLVSTANIKAVIGDGKNFKVVSDGTLSGNGTMNSPLGISKTELNRAVIDEIDLTPGKGGKMPENPKRGDRYVTKERVTDYGYLYPYKTDKGNGVVKIKEMLELDGRGWRIPTKEDWDCLLNSLEPCGKERIHDSAICHQFLGKYAGKKLKSTCGWNCCPDENCLCQDRVPHPGDYCETDDENIDDVEFDDETYIDDETINNDVVPAENKVDYCGTDEIGMRIMPTGYHDGIDTYQYFGSRTRFWTDSHVKMCAAYGDTCVDGDDLYIKEFACDKSGVWQEPICPTRYSAVRLVKDFTGDNYVDAESIDGNVYKTILVPECSLIWTESNFASKKYAYKEPNDGFIQDGRIVYFINVWNGKEWEKRALTEGESFVQLEGNEHCQYNIEYRIYINNDCDQVKVNVDDTVVQRVVERIEPLIKEERDRAISAETYLQEEIDGLADALSAETEARIDADAVLQQMIDDETTRAQQEEQALWKAIEDEAEARDAVDQQIWSAITEEAEARDAVDQQIWSAITAEADARNEVDQQLWSAITEEATTRQTIDNNQWDVINQNRIDLEEVDHQLWSAITEEATTRQIIDNQQWDAINAEIARAKAREDEIDGQLIDATKDYTLSAHNPEGGYNLILESKDGNEEHFVKLKFNADFGTF